MRLNKYIAVSLLFTVASSALACSWFPSHAGNVLLYRIMPLDESDYSQYATTWESDCVLHKDVDYKQENLHLWQQQTSKGISLSDIDAIVYKADLSKLQDIRNRLEKLTQNDNSFVRWLKANKRPDIVDFLILAKQNEKILQAMNDPWYYHVEDNGYYQQLAENIELCKQYKTGPLFSRYALQMVRALCLSRQYGECVGYWEQVKASLPNDVIKKMAELKAASALYKTGHQDEALEIYARYGDIASIRAVNGGEMGDELEFVYDHHPNSPYIEGEIQKWLLYFGEDDTWKSYRNGDTWGWDSTKIDGLLRVAHKAVKEKKSNKQAMWYYTLAALYDIKAEPYKAMYYLERGQKYRKDAFLRDSYRVLHMWLDAQTAIFDEAYEQRLMEDLKWLVQKIKKEAPAQLFDYPEVEADEFSDEYSSYDEETAEGFQSCANSFYWNDAMRRILLKMVCPRMHEAGKYTREIQLANIAENLLGHYNDYANEMFIIMDRLPYKATRNYFARIYQPQDEFDEFLNSHSKTDKYYWYDILATKCLRERRYNKAIVYLRQIPVSFQKKMNAYDYMDKDPFSYDMETFKYDSLLAPDYKLHFAERMAAHERTMKYDKDPNKRALSKIQYAMGLRNSVHRCWALTRYSSNCENNNNREALAEIAYPEDATIYRHDDYMQLSDKLISESIPTFTDKEQVARELRSLLFFKRILDSYGDMQIARDIRQHCDRWKDYVCQK